MEIIYYYKQLKVYTTCVKSSKAGFTVNECKEQWHEWFIDHLLKFEFSYFYNFTLI